ncbi:MAG TPA: hypothetical protein VFX92_13300 [Candidatus Krumholzibacteria bacterium]|nr:hypothetical protein [Candidatus Krumholzibacteria bacterium]
MDRKHYAGIDLGQRFHQVAVVDEVGQVVREPFRIGRGRRGVESLIERAGVEMAQLVVSVEATAIVRGSSRSTLPTRL